MCLSSTQIGGFRARLKLNQARFGLGKLCLRSRPISGCYIPTRLALLGLGAGQLGLGGGNLLGSSTTTELLIACLLYTSRCV